MYRFITNAMNRSRAVLAIMLALGLAGVSSYISLPREADPDIPIPIIYVGVPLPGISPVDAERLIVKPMELEFRSLEGLKEMRAIAAQNFGAVILEFDVSFDADKAMIDVREKMDRVRPEFPEDAEEPDIREFNAGLFPVILVNLTSNGSEIELYRYARALRDELSAMSSVLETNLVGHREEVMEIIIDPTAMENYGISAEQIYTLLSRNNQLIPAGDFDSGGGRFALSVPGLVDGAGDLYDLPLRKNGNAVVRLSDVAKIERKFKDVSNYVRFNGQPTIAVEVTKRLGANIIDTTREVKIVTRAFTADWPENIGVNFSSDLSDFVFQVIGTLEDSIANAIILVMILVVATLGLRSAVMVGLSIPLSFLIGLFAINVFGLTLNMMVLFSFVLCVGILVDGAIVIVEFADRKMAEGAPRREAFALASSRMLWPIVSSTATTVAAFAPIIFWPGVTGKFMSYLPMTVIIILCASVVTAMFFLPVIGGLIGKSEQVGSDVLASLAGDRKLDVKDMTGMTGRYLRLLKRCLHAPIITIMVAIGILYGVINLYATYNNGVELSLDVDPIQANIFVRGRGNISVEEADAITRLVEQIIMDEPGVSAVVADAGKSSNAGGPSIEELFNSGPRDKIALIRIEFSDYRTRRRSPEIIRDIERQASQFAGVQIEIINRDTGPPNGQGIEIEIAGAETKDIIESSERVIAYLKSKSDLYDDIQDSLPLPGIEWSLEVDREKASRYQVDIATVGNVVQLVTKGLLIGHYRPDDSEDEIEIRVRYPNDARSIEQLDNLRVTTPEGNVPITNFVTRKPTMTRDTITRVDGWRVIEVTSDTAINPASGEKYLATKAENDFEEWQTTQEFPPGVRITLRGANEEAEESTAFLGRAMLASLFMMFIILLTQFNSLYCTLLILSTVVMSTIGVLLGLAITGQSFSVIMTGTGVIALAGIVVNNSIVLIDTYQRQLKSGMDAVDAILKTAGQRLRPILLTTFTTIIGLLPMALHMSFDIFNRSINFGEPTASYWVPLGTAVIFGLGFSTLLTLILVPVMLVMPTIIRRRVGQFMRGEQTTRGT